jgi:hypothetical protein
MLAFVLNLPWTLLGLAFGTLSLPTSIQWNREHRAFILYAKSFWWYVWLPGQANARAMTIGHVVVLSPKELPKDLEHELVHVQQYDRIPFIFPLLYYIEVFTKGYSQSKYEIEAYKVSGNPHLGK